MSLLKLSLAALSASFLISSVQAADLILMEADPIIEMASPSGFDGPYAGILGTAGSDGIPFGGVGVVVGANATVGGSLVLGAELQGTVFFNNVVGYSGAELLALGRVGFAASDAVLVYAAGGVGYFWPVAAAGAPFYAVGVGAEFAVSDDMAVRAEVLGFGDFGVAPTGYRGTIGLLFQF